MPSSLTVLAIPTITGSGVVGEVLTLFDGQVTTTAGPVSVAQREMLSGATVRAVAGNLYTVLAEDAGRALAYRVTWVDMVGQIVIKSATLVAQEVAPTLDVPLGSVTFDADQAGTADLSTNFSGGSLVFSIVAGALPEGVALQANGLLVANSPPGPASNTNLTIRAQNGAGFADATLSISILDGVPTVNGLLTESGAQLLTESGLEISV